MKIAMLSYLCPQISVFDGEFLAMLLEGAFGSFIANYPMLLIFLSRTQEIYE